MKVLNYKGDRTPEDVLAGLAEAGSMEWLRADCRTMEFDRKSKDQHAHDANKIGELTFKHDGEHNEILKSLKSDDIKNVRWPNSWASRVGYYYNQRSMQWEKDPYYRPTRRRPSVVSLPHEKA